MAEFIPRLPEPFHAKGYKKGEFFTSGHIAFNRKAAMKNKERHWSSAVGRVPQATWSFRHYGKCRSLTSPQGRTGSGESKTGCQPVDCIRVPGRLPNTVHFTPLHGSVNRAMQ
jgi:hypothetical protein